MENKCSFQKVSCTTAEVAAHRVNRCVRLRLWCVLVVRLRSNRALRPLWDSGTRVKERPNPQETTCYTDNRDNRMTRKRDRRHQTETHK